MGFRIPGVLLTKMARSFLAFGLGGGLLVATILLARATEAPKPAPQAKPAAKLPDRVDPRDPVDDGLLVRIMEARLPELAKAGRTLPRWQDQLTPRVAQVELPPAPTKRLTAAEVYERAAASVVIVGVLYKCDRHSYGHVSMASGFVVSKSGVVVTNLHVLTGYGSSSLGIAIMTRDARVWPVKSILAVDSTNDALALQAEGSDFVPLPLGDDPPIGATVSVISHPAERFFYLTSGIVSRYSISREEGDPTRVLNITGDYARGSSGAPVIDDRGRLAGLVRSTESISHEQSSRRDSHQMVIHNCAPAKAVRGLFATATPAEPAKVK
jgi:serine protease Do